MIRHEPWELQGPTLRKTRSQITKELWENRNTEIWNQQVAGELRHQHAMTIKVARKQDMKLPRNEHDEINRLRFRSWGGRQVIRHTLSNEHSLLPFQSGGNWYRHADSTEQNQNMTVFWIQRWEKENCFFYTPSCIHIFTATLSPHWPQRILALILMSAKIQMSVGTISWATTEQTQT